MIEVGQLHGGHEYRNSGDRHDNDQNSVSIEERIQQTRDASRRKLAEVRAQIDLFVDIKSREVSQKAEEYIAHPTHALQDAGKFAWEKGKWIGFGAAVRMGTAAIGGAIDIAGKPITVIGATIVKAVRDTYREYADYAAKGARQYFHDHVGSRVMQEEKEGAWSKVENAYRGVTRGAVDVAITKSYNVEEHKKQVQVLSIIVNDTDPSQTLAMLSSSDTEKTRENLVGFMQQAKLAIDTADTREARLEARRVMVALYKASQELGHRTGRLTSVDHVSKAHAGSVRYQETHSVDVWSEEEKNRFKNVVQNVNTQLDTYGKNSRIWASLGRLAHAPVVAGLPAFVGAHVFEHTVGQTEWFQNFKTQQTEWVKGLFHKEPEIVVAQPMPTLGVKDAAISDPVEHTVVHHELSMGRPRMENNMPDTSGNGGNGPLQNTEGVIPVLQEDQIERAWQFKDDVMKFVVEKGDGIFQTLDAAGYDPSLECSGEQFLNQIACNFRLSAEDTRVLESIVAKNPRISAEDLRIEANKLMDFDKAFMVKPGEMIMTIPPQDNGTSAAEIAFMQGDHADANHPEIKIGQVEEPVIGRAKSRFIFTNTALQPTPIAAPEAPVVEAPKPVTVESPVVPSTQNTQEIPRARSRFIFAPTETHVPPVQEPVVVEQIEQPQVVQTPIPVEPAAVIPVEVNVEEPVLLVDEIFNRKQEFTISTQGQFLELNDANVTKWVYVEPDNIPVDIPVNEIYVTKIHDRWVVFAHSANAEIEGVRVGLPGEIVREGTEGGMVAQKVGSIQIVDTLGEIPAMNMGGGMTLADGTSFNLELENIQYSSYDVTSQQQISNLEQYLEYTDENSVVVVFCGRSHAEAIDTGIEFLTARSGSLPPEVADAYNVLITTQPDPGAYKAATETMFSYIYQQDANLYDRMRWLYDGYGKSREEILAHNPLFWSGSRYIMELKVTSK